MMHPEEEQDDDAAAAAAGSRMMIRHHGDVDDRRHENDGIMSLDDVISLPPFYRRIFVAGTVAFVLLVLLAASTLSQTIPYELVNKNDNSFINSNTNNKGSPSVDIYNTNQQQRDEMEQGAGTSTSSSNMTSFAESMVNLVQQSANVLAQTVHQYEQNNNNQGGGEGDGGGSPSIAPAPVPSAAPVPAPTASSSSPTSAPPPPSAAPAATPVAASSPTTPPDANGITEGSVNGIAYYGCRASSNVEKTILLFHGASFSKEQWKSSGILDSMCSQSTLTVYAFDMSVSSTGEDLKTLMDAMVAARLLMSLPVNAIVTPSASGSMVVDWGLKTVSNSTSSSSTLPAMSSYWKLWVPVASPAVAYVDPKSLLSSMFPNIQILAVHGDQDTSGGRVMDLLGTYAGAKVVTITGGHACYMQSPTDFVQAVLSEVQ